MPKRIKRAIDREAFYEYLWKNCTDSRNCINITQMALADKLDVRHDTICRIYAEYLLEGRLRKIGPRFYVVDPEIWRWRNPQPPVPTRVPRRRARG